VKSLLAKAVSYFKWGGFLFMMFGASLFGYLGMAVPAWYENLKAKSWMVTMALMFLGNMVENNLLATGAFEIYVDDKEVFSKLKEGRMMTQGDLSRVFNEMGILP
jgi:thioredoxin reductase-like selenoprotein T